jgi:hypothetical protein
MSGASLKTGDSIRGFATPLIEPQAHPPITSPNTISPVQVIESIFARDTVPHQGR